MDTKQEIEVVHDFLKSSRLTVLATISSEKNAPEAALLYYYYNGNKSIYVATAENSRKIKNIQSNNKVSLVIKHPKDAIVLQIDGTAKVTHDNSIKADVLEKISEVANANDDSNYFPPLLSLTEKSHMEFIEITIEWFKYSNFETHFPSIMQGTFEKWEKATLSK